MSEENISKIVRAVILSIPDAEVIQESLVPLRGKKKYYLGPRDIGAVGSQCARVSVIIGIKERLVGIGLKQGVQLFNRIRVDQGIGEGGEYLVRTILDHDEEIFLKKLICEPKNIILAAFRLPSYASEMVDLARRNLKGMLKQAIGTHVNVIPITGRHKFEGKMEKEETVLLALSHFPEMNDVLIDMLGLPGDQDATFFLRVGSLEYQGYRNLSAIWGNDMLKSDHKINLTTFLEGDENMDMLEVFNTQPDQADIFSLVKRYSTRGSPEWLVIKRSIGVEEGNVEDRLDRGLEHRKEWKSHLPVMTWSNSGFARTTTTLKRSVPPQAISTTNTVEPVRPKEPKKSKQKPKKKLKGDVTPKTNTFDNLISDEEVTAGKGSEGTATEGKDENETEAEESGKPGPESENEPNGEDPETENECSGTEAGSRNTNTNVPPLTSPTPKNKKGRNRKNTRGKEQNKEDQSEADKPTPKSILKNSGPSPTSSIPNPPTQLPNITLKTILQPNIPPKPPNPPPPSLGKRVKRGKDKGVRIDSNQSKETEEQKSKSRKTNPVDGSKTFAKRV